MYEATTRDVTVRVEPQYDETRSKPAEHAYFWIYTIHITNGGTEPVRLVSRHWEITDGTGRREDVNGPGVVGKMPVIAPGATYSYASGCPLTTPSGIMVGTFELVLADGSTFDCDIPAFSLDIPSHPATVN